MNAASPVLTAGQNEALRNLARKKAGEAVPWINIADARWLTDCGLAARTEAGWLITAQGERALAQQPPPPPGPDILP